MICSLIGLGGSGSVFCSYRHHICRVVVVDVLTVKYTRNATQASLLLVVHGTFVVVLESLVCVSRN